MTEPPRRKQGQPPTLMFPFFSSSDTHVLVAATSRASSLFSSYSFRVLERNSSALSLSFANLLSSWSFCFLGSGAYGLTREENGNDRFCPIPCLPNCQVCPYANSDLENGLLHSVEGYRTFPDGDFYWFRYLSSFSSSVEGDS